jgi:hypothetical protein
VAVVITKGLVYCFLLKSNKAPEGMVAALAVWYKIIVMKQDVYTAGQTQRQQQLAVRAYAGLAGRQYAG